MVISHFALLYALTIICEGSRCYGDSREPLLKAENANMGTRHTQPFPRLSDLNFTTTQHSHDVLVSMKAPEGTTTTFHAILHRPERTQKTCKMTLDNNVLSCRISQLQPNSVYNVALKVCIQEDFCIVYDNNRKVQTMPGVPRYISVSHRTNNTFRVSWIESLEDPNGQYVYKVKAVYNNEVHTCDSSSSDKSPSCILTNLKKATKYEVSATACRSDNFCSDYTATVVGETTPTPPGKSWLQSRTSSTLKATFQKPNDRSTFEYAASWEPDNDLNVYRSGCSDQYLFVTDTCEIDSLAPNRRYKFRSFACTKDTFLCAEGETLFMETMAQEPMSLQVASLDDGRLYASWHSNMTAEDNPGLDFQVQISEAPEKKYRVPVAEGNFSHVFEGFIPGEYYEFQLQLCNATTCVKKDSFSQYSYNRGVNVQPATNITATTAVIHWTERTSRFGKLPVSFVYATPKDASLGQQMCAGEKLDECTLNNLWPDTEYTVVVKGCENVGRCYPPSDPITLRTAKIATLEALSDVQVKDITGTSLSLSWRQPPVDRSSSFEYKVTLKSTNDPDIAERSFFCETTTLETGEVSCQVDDVYTDVDYSISLTACATANLCGPPSEPIIVKLSMKDGYTLHPPTIESQYINVSWSSSQAKPGNEFRVLVNSSVVETCAPEVTVGEHSCRISGLLPTQKYNVKIVECQKGTHVCGDLCSFLVQTTTDGRLHSMLTDLAKDIDHPTTAPADSSSQLMIRVAYSKLGVPAVVNLKAVSAVITPVAMGNPPRGPNWSSVSSNPAESSKVLQMVGGTYMDPIDGSWEVRLHLPATLSDEDVLLGSGDDIIMDSHNYNGQLAAGTTYAIQLRVYTNEGFGTTAATQMSTTDSQTANGGLIAVSVVFAILCVALIVSIYFFVDKRRKLVFSPSEPTKAQMANASVGRL